jgi:hypothetical protein
MNIPFGGLVARRDGSTPENKKGENLESPYGQNAT